MKAMLASVVLSFALLLSPGVAKASDAPAQDTASMGSAYEIPVDGVSLSNGYLNFTGKLKIKLFVMIKGVLHVKVDLHGKILDTNGYEIPVNEVDVLIVISDITASCKLVQVALASVKVDIKGLNIKIRLNESLIVFNNDHCGDNKKFCKIAEAILKVKVQCVLVVELLNDLWGFKHRDGDGHGRDD